MKKSWPGPFYFQISLAFVQYVLYYLNMEAQTMTQTSGEAAAPRHNFDKRGLGQYPYRFTGMAEKVFIVAAGTKHAHAVPGSSCDYCGTPIRYEFWLQSKDGKTFKVGCDCIERSGDDPVLTKQIKDAQLAHARKIAQERRAAGLATRREERAAANAERLAQWTADHLEFVAELREFAQADSFLTSAAADLDKWGSLFDWKVERCAQILTTIRVPKPVEKASEYLGEPGEKITVDVQLTYLTSSSNTFNGHKVFSVFYTGVTPEGDLVKWNRSDYLGNDERTAISGDIITITGSVKGYGEYDGKRQTVLTRTKLVDFKFMAFERERRD